MLLDKFCGLIEKEIQSCIYFEVASQFLFYLHCFVQELYAEVQWVQSFVFTKKVLSELEIWSNQIVRSE